jgi:hypothetical protein
MRTCRIIDVVIVHSETGMPMNKKAAVYYENGIEVERYFFIDEETTPLLKGYTLAD